MNAGAGDIPSGAAVRHGFVWNLMNFVFSQGAGIAIFLILAWQISPAVFGVFALAALVVDLFANQGRWAIIDALVQRQTFTPRALSSAFWSFTGVAIVLALAFALAAGPVARALDAPNVAEVLPVLGLTMLLTPGAAVMDSLLMRNLQFRSQAIRNMIGTVAGGLFGLAVAFGPAPEWALVAQRLGANVVTLVVLFVFTRWTPSLAFDRDEAWPVVYRAAQLWIAMLLATVHARIVEAAIGARAGPGALGLVTVAQRFEAALHGPITGPIQALWVPVLSKLRDNPAEGWRLFVNLSRLAALIAIPAFVGMGLVSKDLVKLALDARYEHAADILFVLGMTGFLIPIGYFGNLVFAALDRSDLSLKFSIGALCVIAPLVWIVSGAGAVWALTASLSVMGAMGVLVTVTQIRMLGGDLRSFARALAPPYLAGAAMMAAVLSFAAWLPVHQSAVRLICEVLVGGLVYLGVLALFFRDWAKAVWAFLSEVRAPAEPVREDALPAAAAT